MLYLSPAFWVHRVPNIIKPRVKVLSARRAVGPTPKHREEVYRVCAHQARRRRRSSSLHGRRADRGQITSPLELVIVGGATPDGHTAASHMAVWS